MFDLYRRVPTVVTLAATCILLLYGPIEQLRHYHAFADLTPLWGIPHFANVASNIGFALVGFWGLVHLHLGSAPSSRGKMGFTLFFIGLILTAIGSSYYHLAPDDARIVWDRLPIALACAGLLAGMRSELCTGSSPVLTSIVLGIAAIAAVAWWHLTNTGGHGDLRWYLLMQALPLVLIPLWQSIHAAPTAQRLGFGFAIALYVVAKIAETHDHQILEALGVVTGHTVKHLLATAAAVVITRTIANMIPSKSMHEDRCRAA